MLGVSGFDALVPDPSREAAEASARRIGAVERAAAAIDRRELGDADLVDREVLVALAGAARRDLEHGSWEANASADAYGCPQGQAFMAVAATSLPDAPAVEAYLQRLMGLGPFFDGVARRYVDAAAAGRRPSAVGVRQAVEQLSGHLAQPSGRDAFQRPALPGDVPEPQTRARIARTVEEVVRPAMRRLAAVLEDGWRPWRARTTRPASATSPAVSRPTSPPYDATPPRTTPRSTSTTSATACWRTCARSGWTSAGGSSAPPTCPPR